jgi:hypothetical protein
MMDGEIRDPAEIRWLPGRWEEAKNRAEFASFPGAMYSTPAIDKGK